MNSRLMFLVLPYHIPRTDLVKYSCGAGADIHEDHPNATNPSRGSVITDTMESRSMARNIR